MMRTPILTDNDRKAALRRLPGGASVLEPLMTWAKK